MRVEVEFAQSRRGRNYDINYGRLLAEPTAGVVGVIDSECDSGVAGDVALRHLRGCAELLAHGRTTALEGSAAISQALRCAHEDIRATSFASPGSIGGASTTVCAVLGNHVVGAHVGDTRLYALEDGQWVRKTVDHTLREVHRLQPEGSLPDLLRMRDQRAHDGVLLRVVGVTEALECELISLAARPGDRYMLCTRGAWSAVDSEGLGGLWPTDGRELGLWLMNQCERDNATVVIFRL